MLWYKSWLETRWRFLIGLALLVAFFLPEVPLRDTSRAAATDASRACCA